MRYYIIFGVTFILLLIILFYNPYLGIYKDSISIEYNYDNEGYSWNYSSDNDCLSLKENSDNKWIFVPNKDGKTKLIFKYSSKDNVKYKIEYLFRIKGNKIYWLDGTGYGLLDFPNPS